MAGWSDGTLPQWLWKEYEVAEGRHLTTADDLRKADVAVLSAPVCKQMFAPEVNPVGETVLMAGRTFTVVGVFAPHTIFNTPLYRDERGFADNGVWVPASVCEEWPTPGGIGNIEVRVRSPALFLAESMTGLVGALAGAALGFATGAAVETAMTPVAFAPQVIASAICGAIAVSALFGIVPARRAAAVDAAGELAAA